jgi:hypothetical protein
MHPYVLNMLLHGFIQEIYLCLHVHKTLAWLQCCVAARGQRDTITCGISKNILITQRRIVLKELFVINKALFIHLTIWRSMLLITIEERPAVRHYSPYLSENPVVECCIQHMCISIKCSLRVPFSTWRQCRILCSSAINIAIVFPFAWCLYKLI